MCISHAGELLTCLLWIRQKSGSLAHLLEPRCVILEAGRIQNKSFDSCAGHIHSGTDDKVSQPDFNGSLFSTLLPVSQMYAIVSITSSTIKYLQSSEPEITEYNVFLQFRWPDSAPEAWSVLLQGALIPYTAGFI